jgi:hypothetical protein
MSPRLEAVLAAIDAANAADPTTEGEGAEAGPAALLYGQRMSAELARVCQQTTELLQIAARGQHIERWKILPRRPCRLSQMAQGAGRLPCRACRGVDGGGRIS